MNDTENMVKAILDAGAASVLPTVSLNGVPFITVPDGYKVEDLERMQPTPLRKRAGVEMYDVMSFCDYVNLHGNQEFCTIYCDIDQQVSKAIFVAVIDDHGAAPSKAMWRQHTCRFTPRQSVEWQRWTGKNCTAISQDAFAAWIEDNVQDVSSKDGLPNGTQMLEMALNFERHAEKRFKQKIDLQGGGVHLEYLDNETSDTRYKMQVFERFMLGIQVFIGGAHYELQARLKYRQESGALKFWYELIRADKVFNSATQDLVDLIRSNTGMRVLIGKPGL